MPKIKIYNHNIRWSGSKKQHLEIAKKIELLQPDIVCLQEVALEKQAKLFQIEGYSSYYISVSKPKTAILTSIVSPIFDVYKNLENNYLYAVNKPQKIKLFDRIKNLKNIKLKKEVKVTNREFLKGYLLILTRDNPNKISYKKYKTQGGLVKNLAERIAGKGFMELEFDDFNIFNTHLLSSHKKNKVELDQNNSEQLTELLKFSQNSKNTILVGDFNFGPDSSKYSLMNSWHDLTKEIPVTEYFWKTRLDYIFTNFKPIYSSVNIVQFENEPSDHYGIWCELEF